MVGGFCLDYLSNRIAAEIRLPEAIDRKLLCPFQYFGVTDSVDLDDLKWAAGGYDKTALSNIYSMSGYVAKQRANLILSSMLNYVTDVNDVKGIGFCVTVEHAEFMSHLQTLQIEEFSALERRMFRMFYMTVWGKAFDEESREALAEKLTALAESPLMVQELQELLRYQYDRIDFIDEPVDLGFDCPLDLHCSYSRDQILAAMDFLKPATVREGVKWLPEQKLDVFFVTLNKSDKDYSPTTMYNDYSINETLFHWQSQSTTGEQSATGQRYIHHKERGSRILLFVREFKSDRISNTAAAYTYLGTANYVKHEGSKPMNITWRLDAPIPAKYLRKTNKLVVG